MGAAYMCHSYQAERSEELVRNAKYKAIPNGLQQAMMQMKRPVMILNVASEAPKAAASTESGNRSKLVLKPETKPAESKPESKPKSKRAITRKKGTADQQKHAHTAAPDSEKPAVSN